MQDLTITHDHIRATTVNGTDVFNAQGEHLGHIDDIVLSKTAGNAVYAIMSFGGFGIGERYHPLPWQSLSYDQVICGYVVSVSREQLECAPNYVCGTEPDWNDPGFDGRLSRYYGRSCDAQGCAVISEDRAAPGLFGARHILAMGVGSPPVQ